MFYKCLEAKTATVRHSECKDYHTNSQELFDEEVNDAKT